MDKPGHPIYVDVSYSQIEELEPLGIIALQIRLLDHIGIVADRSGTYPVLCAYSIFCQKIRFFAIFRQIFNILSQ